MISIVVDRDAEGLVRACQISGHAGYDVAGYDIVCAAVSALSCTAIVGLEQVAKQKGHYSNGEGQCRIELSGPITESGQAILETMILGLSEISRQYSEFVKISET